MTRGEGGSYTTSHDVSTRHKSCTCLGLAIIAVYRGCINCREKTVTSAVYFCGRGSTRRAVHTKWPFVGAKLV
jgi:hypothetical protein